MQIKKKIAKPGSPTIQKKKQSSIPTAMEYIQLFNTCVINKERVGEVDKLIDEKVTVSRAKYEGISNLVKSSSGANITAFGTGPLFQSSYIPFYNRYSNSPPATNSGYRMDAFNANSSATKSLLTDLVGANFADKLQGVGRQVSNFINGNDTAFNKDIFSLNSVHNSGASVPWYFIACVHYLECSFSFKKHLHNGDPLTNYTVHVPAHRPKVGHGPPFTFEESALDAIKLMKYDQVTNWSLAYILQKLEGYNGFGYNKKGIRSPYLWSYSNHYVKGKYVKDGVFDANAISHQLGSAVLLKRMEQRGIISIPRN